MEKSSRGVVQEVGVGSVTWCLAIFTNDYPYNRYLEAYDEKNKVIHAPSGFTALGQPEIESGFVISGQSYMIID
ncbi:5719_t:CDS:2 [Acaulospora colombiana]|uniref:5719_t:CDS:1 n=1 Tax=Acaulospora colombiana TaxID=27376 RepID=A0ACA9N4Q5_9GLOM|nr:5719_t:CDS:2 [Acaulospora colombiana]